ncbi:MAG: DUF2087 domain-containing protein [Anaerorhabdus sp.]
MIDFSEIGVFLNESNKVVLYPAKRKKKLVVLFYLSQKFDRGKEYSEKEINEILSQWHTFNDVAILRRELCDHHFLARDKAGLKYWLQEVQPTLEDNLNKY